jgi:hypothetical protein
VTPDDRPAVTEQQGREPDSPAIDRMTPDERAIWVRCMAKMFLRQAQRELEAEAASDAEAGNHERKTG